MLQEDSRLGGATVAGARERAGGGGHDEQNLKTATRFGVWRARWKWALACRLRDSSMSELHDAHPMKTTVNSIAESVAERTRGLPGRGFLPLNPDAPLLSLKEAAWLGVIVAAIVWAVLLTDGVYPILSLLHDPMVREAVSDL